MPDLNILEMLSGNPPAYSSVDPNTQKLVVLMMVSDNDIGRSYGGELADLPGKISQDLDVLTLKITAMLKDAIQWMKDNDPSVPDSFNATMTVEKDGNDKLTLMLNTFVRGQSTGTTDVPLW